MVVSLVEPTYGYKPQNNYIMKSVAMVSHPYPRLHANLEPDDPNLSSNLEIATIALGLIALGTLSARSATTDEPVIYGDGVDSYEPEYSYGLPSYPPYVLPFSYLKPTPDVVLSSYPYEEDPAFGTDMDADGINVDGDLGDNSE